MPTYEHIIFIPGVLLIGVVLGFILGSRVAQGNVAKKRKRARE